MVTAKRKVNTDEERYGGFSEIEVQPPRTQSDRQSFIEDQHQRAELNFNYSTLEQKNDQPQPNVPYPTGGSRLSQEEIMPVVQKEQVTTNIVSKKKLDKRTKILLGVYLSIIVLLSAFVLTTGILLTSSGTRVNELQSELAAKMAVYNEQIGQIEVLSDEANIEGRALGNGMQRVESSEEIELLPMGDAQTYEGNTNWFDSVCDWLSGVFGG